MSSLSHVAVVILNWNGKKYLEQFLPSVVKYSANAQIIVADNASSDDSVAFLQKNYPQVRIILNSDNGGFSKGYNDAFAQVEAEYAVLLNSDVAVTENWLSPLISLLENDPQVAVCQPKIRSFHAPHLFEYAGAAGGMIDQYGYPFCRGRLFDNLETDEGQYDDNPSIFWATGACMVVRLATYKQLGGLDEHFFAHMEEIDLCWRMKNAGYDIRACGQSIVYHVGGGTLPKNNPRKTFLNFRNGLALLLKNLPASELIPVIFIRLVLDGVAGAKYLFSGQSADTLAIIKAHFNFYAMMPTWIKARKNARKNITTEAKRKQFSIVWQYFIGKKQKYSELPIL